MSRNGKPEERRRSSLAIAASELRRIALLASGQSQSASNSDGKNGVPGNPMEFALQLMGGDVRPGGCTPFITDTSTNDDDEEHYLLGRNYRSHCHDTGESRPVDPTARKKLIMASILCLIFMVAEVIGGYLAGSLAIMTDAAHMMTDFASFMISLFAIWVATRPATKSMNFGYYRAEVMGALVSVLLIWVVTGILVYNAVMRVIHRDMDIDAKIMLITASCGVAVNLVMGFILHQWGHGHSHGFSGHGHSHGGKGHGDKGHGHSHGGQTSTGHGHSHGGQMSTDHSHSNGGQIPTGHGHSHGGQVSTGHGQSNGGQMSTGHGHINGGQVSTGHGHINGGQVSTGHGQSNGGQMPTGHEGQDQSGKGHTPDGPCTNEQCDESQKLTKSCQSNGIPHNYGGIRSCEEGIVRTDIESQGYQMGDPQAELLEKGEDGGEQNRKENVNVRAAFIHVVGDFVQSLGVLVAAIIIYFRPDWAIADPICTFMFSVLVLITTLSILRDTVNVLMEGTPRGLDFNSVKESLKAIPGVHAVHGLHIWSLTVGKNALAVHIAVDVDADPQEVLDIASRLVRSRFVVHSSTIQIELFQEEMRDCSHCRDPSD
ncbi:zinc transporter 2-like isoform X1 [Branchiostoma floridae]|uniref:Zinc transporter 2-like isoform X1 n=1 Tax=Branchiostoma floridae TaxID=7739 RepID=A0A9J7HJN5_BRAFL|nr:zinc transporter 2-like isoform X1 [Branchiostoma floridae]